ncbi:actin-associated protein FAM107A-like [Bufo bufo]|uniref:actin-associated protein FAM107A-like n=1 Tax=Bufo bufo TaxID=8384 RepID=UPI001ABED8BA|nr:actin-associated protein FAM107A-like [Bufo bufo]
MSQTPEEKSLTKTIDQQWRMNPPIPPQCRISQELWMWAKCQVLSSLRMPFGIGNSLPALKKAAGKEGSCNSVSITPYKPDNPMKSSRTHQELHRELLLTYKKGLVLHSKPELLRVMEKRRSQWQERQDTKTSPCPLQQELHKWQLRREEKEQKSTNEGPAVHEFLKVRENLRKSSTKDAQSPPPPVS